MGHISSWVIRCVAFVTRRLLLQLLLADSYGVLCASMGNKGDGFVGAAGVWR
jgi:hypothetical protein